MKRIIDFGKIPYTSDKVANRVTVEIELKEKENGQKVFTASGNIWNRTNTDIICGGQCLDEISRTEIGINPKFKQIYRLWKLYHLNDMHAECEHQEALGWKEQAAEPMTIYHFMTTTETYSRRREIEKKVIDDAKKGSIVNITDDERKILKLENSIETEEAELPESIRAFYKLSRKEPQHRGWVSFDAFPSGLLCKPCPVCLYKYGTAWTYREISEEDLKIIRELMEV